MPIKTVARPKARTLDEALIYMTEKMAETDAKIAESNAKSDAKIAESDAKIAESQAKTDLVIQRLAEKVDKLADSVKEVLSGLGTVGNRLGDMVELVVIPGLRLAINAYGHDFKRSTANKTFNYIGRNGRKQELTEVDLFLSDGTEAMAVEIKATLKVSDVNNNLGRLKKLRQYEKETNLQGKKLYGAVVGVYVNEDARKLALKNGLYVVEIQEEEKKLKTDKPAKGRIW
jgi:predicted RecB family endonuclease